MTQQTALSAATNLLDIAERKAARLGLDLQHLTWGLRSTHADNVEALFIRLRDAATSARGLIATGHEVEAYRFLSGVLGS